MNLAFVIYSLGSGGAERVTAALANHWAAQGWQVSVITLAAKDQDFYELHPAIRRIALNMADASNDSLTAAVSNCARVRALRTALKEVQPDIAVSMMATANILLAFAAFGIERMMAIGSERSYPPCVALGFVWKKLRAWSYGHLDALVAQTDKSAAWVRDHTRARRITVIPNSVSWPVPSQPPYLPPPKPNAERKMLLAVGRLSEEKGFDCLIEIFEQISADLPTWDLVIVGEGPERSRLQGQVDRAGLGSRLRLPGRAGNVGDWYGSADLYVMSSRFEGFPNTLVEAMAYGLPAVSFDCDTGPRDIIRNEVDGLLVSNGDSDDLEAALRRLMSDQRLRDRLGRKAVEVRDRFSMEHIAKKWEALFATEHHQ